MYKILKDTLDTLADLNEYKDQRIFKYNKICEAYNSIEEILLLEKKVSLCLNNINSIKKSDKKEIIKNLKESYFIYSNFYLKIDEIHDMIIDMITKYDK